MKKLKIGIITHNFPESENDRKNAGIFVYDLAKALSKKSNILVFSPGSAETIKKIGGLKTYFFKFNDKLGNLKIYHPSHLLKFSQFFIDGSRALEKLIKDNPNIDFVISMWAFPSGFFGNQLLRKYRIPYAIYCLGSDIYIYAKKPVLKSLIKSYLKEAKFLLADSPDLARATENLSGKKTIFLPSASNLPFKPTTKIKNGKTVITFLGRLEIVKGIDILLEALENLGEYLKFFEVNIIGEGSLTEFVITKVKHLNSKDIKVRGNISSPRKLSEILSSSNWLIIPSRSDSIPLVFSESMKLGIPVICSNLPDLEYLIQKYKIGLTFKKGDAKNLAERLKNLPSKKAYSLFKSNTKKTASLFDLNKTSDKLINLITNEK